MKKLAIISFTEQGKSLADVIRNQLTEDYSITSDCKCRGVPDCIDMSLTEWTEEKFESQDALIYIGATGIAVRAIAPFVKNKTEDPAVLAIDEKGTYCIPLLSGHIGGANELAVRLSQCIQGMIPVITTATDLNEKWAVDVFARKNQLSISDMKKAKLISARILSGERIRICLEDACVCKGKLPEELALDSEKPDVYIGIRNNRESIDIKKCLRLVPKVTYLGIGCRKGTDKEQIEAAVLDTLKGQGIDVASIVQVVSIDLKKKEPGILAFCEKYGLDYQVYAVEELRDVPGDFETSAFVSSVTGVDNVCERSAVRACIEAGKDYQVIIKKTICHGVTVALTMRDWSVDFE